MEDPPRLRRPPLANARRCGWAAVGQAWRLVIRDKVILHTQPGALPEPSLEELIAKARAVDMDEVRRGLSEQSASA